MATKGSGGGQAPAKATNNERRNRKAWGKNSPHYRGTKPESDKPKRSKSAYGYSYKGLVRKAEAEGMQVDMLLMQLAAKKENRQRYRYGLPESIRKDRAARLEQRHRDQARATKLKQITVTSAEGAVVKL